jgi:hypothetical protein
VTKLQSFEKNVHLPYQSQTTLSWSFAAIQDLLLFLKKHDKKMNISNICAVAKLRSCKKDAIYARSRSDSIIWSFAAIQDFLNSNYCSISQEAQTHETGRRASRTLLYSDEIAKL